MANYLISYQFKFGENSGGFGDHRFSSDGKLDFDLIEERREFIKKTLIEREHLDNPTVVILNVVRLD